MKRLIFILVLLANCSDNIAEWEAQEKLKTYYLMRTRVDIPCIEAMPCDINWCGPNADKTKDCKKR